MEYKNVFTPLRIIDIKKLIWVGSEKSYSFLNRRIQYVQIIGTLSDVEYKNGCFGYK